jgi:hypothetical protein
MAEDFNLGDWLWDNASDWIIRGLSGLATSLLGESFEGGAADAYNALRKQAALDTLALETEQTERHNLAVKTEVERLAAAQSAVAEGLALVQLNDASRAAMRFHLLSQDFTRLADEKQADKVSAYSGSGVQVKGSALTSLRMTRERGEEGANRLKKAADIALQRGKEQAEVTRMKGATAPGHVPEPMPYLRPFAEKTAHSYDHAGAFLGGFASGMERSDWSGLWGGLTGWTEKVFSGSGGGGGASGWNVRQGQGQNWWQY